MDDQHFAGVHAAITALSVDVGRLSERLIALDAKLVTHTRDEHQEFKEALQIVAAIKEDVNNIQAVLDQHKGAWWALAKIGVVILGIASVGAVILQWIRD